MVPGRTRFADGILGVGRSMKLKRACRARAFRQASALIRLSRNRAVYTYRTHAIACLCTLHRHVGPGFAGLPRHTRRRIDGDAERPTRTRGTGAVREVGRRGRDTLARQAMRGFDTRRLRIAVVIPSSGRARDARRATAWTMAAGFAWVAIVEAAALAKRGPRRTSTCGRTRRLVRRERLGPCGAPGTRAIACRRALLLDKGPRRAVAPCVASQRVALGAELPARARRATKLERSPRRVRNVCARSTFGRRTRPRSAIGLAGTASELEIGSAPGPQRGPRAAPAKARGKHKHNGQREQAASKRFRSHSIRNGTSRETLSPQHGSHRGIPRRRMMAQAWSPTTGRAAGWFPGGEVGKARPSLGAIGLASSEYRLPSPDFP
jgi:hypothetical protein